MKTYRNRLLFIFLCFIISKPIGAQSWCQKANYPGSGRVKNFGFEINGSLFVGCGGASGTNFSDFWKYDALQDQWTQVANFPGSPRRNGVSFSIGNYGYAGIGFNGSTQFSSFYRYDPVNNSWTARASYPGNGLRGTMGAVLNGKAYVGGGTDSSVTPNSDLWEYDPVSDNWTLITNNWPLGDRTGGMAIGIGQYVYFGFGQNTSRDFNDLWRYDPSSNQWTQMASLTNGHRFHSIVLNFDSLIILGGGRRLGGAVLGDFYSYNYNTNSWASFPAHIDSTRWTAVGLSTDQYGYVISGVSNRNTNVLSGHLDDTWELGRLTSDMDSVKVCDADSVIINASRSSASYTWQNGSTNSNFVARSSGLYWVDINQNGCLYTDSFIVDLANINLDLGNDTTLCAGNTLTLDAQNPGATYLWQDNSTVSTFTVTQAGQYYVEVDLNGCIERDTINVNYNPNPTVDLGSDTTLCAGNTLTLDAQNPGAAYTWQNNSTASTFAVTQAGQYYVEVDLNGCLGSDTINVNFDPNPTVDLGNDTTLCQGSSLSLDATNAGSTYLWQDNSTSSNYTVSQAGLYWVEVDLNGCVERDSILVTYQNLPQVNLGADTTLCDGNTLTLDATNLGATYLWQDNSNTSAITVTQAGQYFVEVNLNGCIERDTINVNYNPSPTVDLGNDTTLCQGSSLSLDATNAVATYLWQDNSTAATFNVNQAGLYWAEVDLNGCVERDSIRIEFDTLPQIEMVSDSLFCEGEGILLEPLSSSPGPYLWQDGSLEKTYFATQAGEFYAIISNVCGSDTASINLFAEDCQCLFVWPNVITPNGDRINDDFLPLSACPYESFRLLIFNRWGEKVFESESAGIGWDGRSQGYQSHEGVYIYRFEYRNVGTESKVEVGHFTLIR